MRWFALQAVGAPPQAEARLQIEEADDGGGDLTRADSTGDGNARGPRPARGHRDGRCGAVEGLLLPGAWIPGAAAPGVHVGWLLARYARYLSPDPHHPVADAAARVQRAHQPARSPHLLRGGRLRGDEGHARARGDQVRREHAAGRARPDAVQRSGRQHARVPARDRLSARQTPGLPPRVTPQRPDASTRPATSLTLTQPPRPSTTRTGCPAASTRASRSL